MNWSNLKASEKAEWLRKARSQIYEGLEPWSEEKEALIPSKAREMYYEQAKEKHP